jgi:hypothetical protein
LMLVAETVD